MSEVRPERVARRIDRSDDVKQNRRAARSNTAPRIARQVIARQLTRGDVVRLSPDDGLTYDYVTFKTPSGIVVHAPTEHGSRKVWLLESGTWTYRWGDGDEQVLEVGEPVTQVDIQLDQTSIDPRLLPSLSLSRRPRY